MKEKKATEVELLGHAGISWLNKDESEQSVGDREGLTRLQWCCPRCYSVGTGRSTENQQKLCLIYVNQEEIFEPEIWNFLYPLRKIKCFFINYGYLSISFMKVWVDILLLNLWEIQLFRNQILTQRCLHVIRSVVHFKCENEGIPVLMGHDIRKSGCPFSYIKDEILRISRTKNWAQFLLHEICNCFYFPFENIGLNFALW